MSAAAARTARRTRNARGAGGQLRADIVAAAHRLLDDAGEDAVTLRAIAREIGISAPSIYQHFHDRQDILLAVATDAFDDLYTYLTAAADTADQPDARLGVLAAAYLQYAQDRPRRYLVMFGGAWNAGDAVRAGSLDRDQVTTLGADTMGLFVATLGDQAGARSDPDLHNAATVLWVALHGLAHQRIVAPGYPWPNDIDQRLIDTFAQRRL